VIIINKKSSKSIRVMSLVRVLVLSTLKYNIVIKAKHIPGKINKIADSLSRSDWQLTSLRGAGQTSRNWYKERNVLKDSTAVL
jgi:hypothetical protein